MIDKISQIDSKNTIINRFDDIISSSDISNGDNKMDNKNMIINKTNPFTKYSNPFNKNIKNQPNTNTNINKMNIN